MYNALYRKKYKAISDTCHDHTRSVVQNDEPLPTGSQEAPWLSMRSPIGKKLGVVDVPGFEYSDASNQNSKLFPVLLQLSHMDFNGYWQLYL